MPPITDNERMTAEEFDHWAMFPELYCAGHESGAGPLCDSCADRQADDDQIANDMRDMYKENA